MINNIDTILPLLKFETKGDFVTVLILKRKKDCTTNTNNHQSVRTIKSYTIYSKEQLLERFDEMKLLCETFEARTYINFNTKNDKNVSLKMISKIADRVESGNDNCKHVYDSVIGELKPKQKRWIIDIDKEDLNKVDEIISFINHLEPIGEQKLITKVSTLSGLHLITNPFRLDLFIKQFPKIDVQKNNPTCLYIPNSLTNFVEEEIDSLVHENYMLSTGISYINNLLEEYERTHNLFVEITVGYSGFGFNIYYRNPNEFWLDSVHNSDNIEFTTRELARIDCLKYLQNTDLKFYEK